MKRADEITEFQTVKVNANNYWLLELLYGDAADDKTATFQIPKGISLRTTQHDKP